MKILLSNYKLSIGYFVSLFILALIMTLLGIISVSYNLVSLLSVLFNTILVFIFSFFNSKKQNMKGYKSGLCSWIKIIILLELANIINLNYFNFHFKTIFYYILLLLVSISGAIISKNKSKKLS